MTSRTQQHDLRIRPPHWHRHPAVRTGQQLALGERSADKLRNGMGSWGFVFGSLGSKGSRHDYDTNLESDLIVKEIQALTREIHHHTVPGTPRQQRIDR